MASMRAPSGGTAPRPSLVREVLRRASPRMTRVIAANWGEAFPFYYVSEFPKSGGTWLGQMLADYLQVPFPQHALLPLAFTAVVHNHWRYDPRFRRVVYVARDGRDVMVSLFFHRMRIIRTRSDIASRRFRARYERVFGAGFDADDIVRCLPDFIAEEFRSPLDCPQSWADHTLAWHRAAGVAQVRYEELLTDCPAAMTRVIIGLTGQSPNDWRLRSAIDKYSFERVTGRTRGSEDRLNFVRKGIAGDWRNHFSRRAAEVFAGLAGAALIELGYEPDHGWVEGVQA